MVLALAVPDRYGWVLLAAAGTTWLTFWQTSLVGKHRKAAKIDYPQAYAEKAEVLASQEAKKFNCAQRAHQNTLELLPQTLVCLLVSGLRFPTVGASLGATFLVGRIVYTQGYVTGEPKKRNRGFFGTVALLGLMFTATWTAGELAYATL